MSVPPTRPRPPHRSKTIAIDLPLSARADGESKQDWIYRVIRDRILDRSLMPLARLPSSRELARSWNVSRGVVELAYERLAAEGFVLAAVGVGTLVASVNPDVFLALPAQNESLPAPVSCPAPERHESSLGISAPRRQGRSAFIARTADPALFPLERWRQMLSDCLRRLSMDTLMDEDPSGFFPLRQQIAAYLGNARGLRCDPECVIVVTGIRHAVDLVARTVARGANVLIENPGYSGAYEMFAAAGAMPVPVPVDAQGLDIEAARSVKAAIAYVTPAHQSPTGVVMSVQRRSDLLRWASDNDSWILEDDYDSEINYEGAPLLALKGADTEDRVIHCGSFNKTLFPSLRIGYMVVPRKLLPVIRHMRALTGRSNSITDQVALAEFLKAGLFSSHLRRVRLIYKRRRDIAASIFRNRLGHKIRITADNAGFHFLLWLPEGIQERALRERAASCGIHLHCLSDYSYKSALPAAVLIGFSALTEDQIESSANELSQLILELGQHCDTIQS